MTSAQGDPEQNAGGAVLRLGTHGSPDSPRLHLVSSSDNLLLQTVFMVGLDVPCQGFAPPASRGLRVGHLASGLSRTRSTAAAKSERHLLVPSPEGMDPCLLLFLLLMEHRLGHDSGVQGALSSLG